MDRQAMALALQTGCKYGISDCLTNAKNQLSKYPTESPDQDQKLTTYCYGIQEGDKTDWNKLWSSYKDEINANELSSIRDALACSKDLIILNEYLEIALGDDIRVQDKDRVINAVSRTLYGRDVSWNFIIEHWDWFYDM